MRVKTLVYVVYKLIILLFIVCNVSCTRTDEIFANDDKIYFKFSDSILLKHNLKILDVGNSYTNDATAFLPYLVKKLGVNIDDVCLYKAILGGASFKHWYNVYHDLNSSSYVVSKVVGGIDANVEEGTGDAFDGSYFRRLLSDETWDVIIIHPLSRYATNYEEWWLHDNAGYLRELLEILLEHQPNCNIGFLLVHSPSSDYITNVEHSSLVRWEHIANAAQRFVEEYRIPVLIPYGTAIQNLRATEFNNGAELTRDGTHLGNGLARYTAACCYYESLLAPRTGVSILGQDISYEIVENPETSQYSVIASNMETAQKAAVLACKYPYSYLNPNDFEIEQIIHY